MTQSGRPLAVITGAASGVGGELAMEFADHGFDLVLAAQGTDLLRVADTVAVTTGVKVESVLTDLAKYDGVEKLAACVRDAGRPVEALVINAGAGFLDDTELSDQLSVVNPKVVSSVHLVRRLIPEMARRDGGRVLFTSSVTATMPGPYVATYNASPAFLSSFAAALRTELKDDGLLCEGEPSNVPSGE